MSAPTAKELEILAQFRPLIADLELSDEQKSDMFLLRWLIARELNLKAAEEMLRKSMQWRKDNDIETVLTWEAPKQFQQDFAYDSNGVDKDGCPVFTIPFGKWDVRKAVESGQKAIYLRYFDQLCERALSIMREKSKGRPKNEPITQMTIVWDLDGFSLRQMAARGTIDATLEGVKRFEANYPEILKASIGVNAPRIFALMFGLIKPLLSPRTLEKVQIYGSNANKWRAALLKIIPSDQLLPVYGGTRSGNKEFMDIKARTMDGKNDGTDLDMCIVTVDAGDKLSIALDVKHPNSTLSWSFRTDDFDIGFSVLYNDKDSLLNHERVESHLKKQEGSMVCERPGRYTLLFDNTYSVVRAKTLHYMVSVSSPDESDEEEITSL